MLPNLTDCLAALPEKLDNVSLPLPQSQPATCDCSHSAATAASALACQPADGATGEDHEMHIVFLSQPYVCPFKYNPVDVQWQQRACHSLGLNNHGQNGVLPGGADVQLTPPTLTKTIDGDGNCFFRTISYILTESQLQHMDVRRATVQHMRTIGGLLSPHLDGSYNDIEQYINATYMDMDGIWATDVEILAVSHLLNVPVFSFLESIQRWQRLAPNNVDKTLPESEHGEMAIYMHHPRDHFDVVMSV